MRVQLIQLVIQQLRPLMSIDRVVVVLVLAVMMAADGGGGGTCFHLVLPGLNTPNCG